MGLGKGKFWSWVIPGQKNWKLYFGEETGIQDLVHFIGRKQNLKDRTGLQSDVHKGVGWISAEAQCSSLQLTPFLSDIQSKTH